MQRKIQLKKRIPTHTQLDPVNLPVKSTQLTKSKNPVGRPTKYTPDVCDKVIAMGRQGYCKAEMASELGVSRECIYEWARVHEEFCDALELAMTFSEGWWDHLANKAILLPPSKFNTALWARMMSARFPHKYRETTRLAHSGQKGAPIPPLTQLRPLTGENLVQWYKQWIERITRPKDKFTQQPI